MRLTVINRPNCHNRLAFCDVLPDIDLTTVRCDPQAVNPVLSLTSGFEHWVLTVAAFWPSRFGQGFTRSEWASAKAGEAAQWAAIVQIFGQSAKDAFHRDAL